jgi:carbon storage regulator CsrA
MLVLSRHRHSEICIGPDITIRVLEIHKCQVKLGIEAPSGFFIWRGELTPAARCGQGAVEKRFSRSERSCLATPRRR